MFFFCLCLRLFSYYDCQLELKISQLLIHDVYTEQCVCEHACVYVQRLYGSQRRERPLGDGLELVVVEREQIEVVEVLKCIHTETRYLISIQ